MMKVFPVCLVILACRLAAAILWFPDAPRPILKPDNPFSFFGEEIVMTCTFPGKNSSLAYFQEGNDNVTEDYLSRPNDNTLVYRVKNTSRFEGKVNCNGIPLTCWHPEWLFPGGQILHVDYKPEAPSNAHCVYHKGHVRLWCTWSLAPCFTCLQNLNVSALIHTSSGSIYCQTSTHSSCLSYEAPGLDRVDLIIEIQNRKRPNTTFNFITTIDID